MNNVNLSIAKKHFESIKSVDVDGIETFSARALMIKLGYDKWQNFVLVINKAKEACEKVGINVTSNFTDVSKVQIKADGKPYSIKDIKLSRYACYLIAQNGDPTKQQIALAQTYFAIQTYRQEQMDDMSEEQKRLYVRSQVTNENVNLFKAAKDSGVYRYGTFTDAGYIGLYGLRAKQIREKKDIGNDDILNRAGVTELAANLFRITQTQEVLKNELNKGKKIGDTAATKTHFMVGGKVRQTIKDIGGTLPENLLPEEDVRELEKRIAANDKKQLAPAERPLKIKSGFDNVMEKIATAETPKKSD